MFADVQRIQRARGPQPLRDRRRDSLLAVAVEANLTSSVRQRCCRRPRATSERARPERRRPKAAALMPISSGSRLSAPTSPESWPGLAPWSTRRQWPSRPQCRVTGYPAMVPPAAADTLQRLYILDRACPDWGLEAGPAHTHLRRCRGPDRLLGRRQSAYGGWRCHSEVRCTRTTTPTTRSGPVGSVDGPRGRGSRPGSSSLPVQRCRHRPWRSPR